MYGDEDYGNYGDEDDFGLDDDFGKKDADLDDLNIIESVLHVKEEYKILDFIIILKKNTKKSSIVSVYTIPETDNILDFQSELSEEEYI